MSQSRFPPFTTKWANRFLDLADYIAQWSYDPSTKCGGVIVNNEKQIISTGFNGFPARIEDKPEWYTDREIKYENVIHAEMNLILNATQPVKGCHMFITGPSCPECTKHVIAAGIESIHWRLGQTDFLERWKDKLEVSARIYDRAGIKPFIY